MHRSHSSSSVGSLLGSADWMLGAADGSELGMALASFTRRIFGRYFDSRMSSVDISGIVATLAETFHDFSKASEVPCTTLVNANAANATRAADHGGIVDLTTMSDRWWTVMNQLWLTDCLAFMVDERINFGLERGEREEAGECKNLEMTASLSLLLSGTVECGLFFLNHIFFT